jgi:hypothetical protein
MFILDYTVDCEGYDIICLKQERSKLQAERKAIRKEVGADKLPPFRYQARLDYIKKRIKEISIQIFNLSGDYE